MSPGEESEWKTRKHRIDPRLDAIGWGLGQGAASPAPNRTEEHETQNGPADYVLWHDRNIVGVVDAKKVTIGPQNVLTQAERYAPGLGDTPSTSAACACRSSTPPAARSAAQGSSRRPARRRPIPGCHITRNQIRANRSRGNLPRDAELALDGQAVAGMLVDEQGASALRVS